MRETQRMVQGFVVWDCRRERYVGEVARYAGSIDEALMWTNDERGRARIHRDARRYLGHDDFEVYLVRRGTDTIREFPRPEVSDG